METRILESIKAYEAEILDFTKELVNIDSGVDCPEGVRVCAELVAEKLRPLGFDIELIERFLRFNNYNLPCFNRVKSRYKIVCHLNGSNIIRNLKQLGLALGVNENGGVRMLCLYLF